MYSDRPSIFNNELRDRDPDGLAYVLGDTILQSVEPIYHSMGYVLERAVLLDQEVSRSISHPPIEHLPAPRFNPAPGGRARGGGWIRNALNRTVVREGTCGAL